MIIFREKKNKQIIGAGDIIKSDEEYNYYLTSNLTTDRQRQTMRNKILFKGTKKECQEKIKEL